MPSPAPLTAPMPVVHRHRQSRAGAIKNGSTGPQAANTLRYAFTARVRSRHWRLRCCRPPSVLAAATAAARFRSRRFDGWLRYRPGVNIGAGFMSATASSAFCSFNRRLIGLVCCVVHLGLLTLRLHTTDARSGPSLQTNCRCRFFIRVNFGQRPRSVFKIGSGATKLRAPYFKRADFRRNSET